MSKSSFDRPFSMQAIVLMSKTNSRRPQAKKERTAITTTHGGFRSLDIRNVSSFVSDFETRGKSAANKSIVKTSLDAPMDISHASRVETAAETRNYSSIDKGHPSTLAPINGRCSELYRDSLMDGADSFMLVDSPANDKQSRREQLNSIWKGNGDEGNILVQEQEHNR